MSNCHARYCLINVWEGLTTSASMAMGQIPRSIERISSNYILQSCSLRVRSILYSVGGPTIVYIGCFLRSFGRLDEQEMIL